MHFLQADLLFPVSSLPIRNGILVVDESGKILDLIDPEISKENLPEGIRKVNGFICPGFINAHCHLELSHLKGQFSEKKGLVNFIDQMRLNRSGDDILEAIEKADAEMYSSGVVAVADISNTDHSISTKKKSSIYYHTFIELFDVVPGRATNVFENGKQLAGKFSQENLSHSYAPHAPYTVSAALFKLLSDEFKKFPQLTTIHNQETPQEDEMFQSQSGGLFDFLMNVNPAVKERNNIHLSSLEYILDHLHHFKKLLLVHNTFTNRNHVSKAEKISNNLFWCLCPNANLYIEDVLPDIEMFREISGKVVVGTDSYASNKTLSCFDELKTISIAFPDLSFHELLMWSCKNGADFLDKSDVFGSFEKGKTPGIVHIDNIDLVSGKINSHSIANRFL